MRRTIDHKKIDLTDHEWQLYEEICKSYDRPNFKGADLFRGLFETDGDGIITFLRPPVEYTSMEVYLFMMSVMQHQHLREMYKKVDDLCLQLNEKIKVVDEMLLKNKTA